VSFIAAFFVRRFSECLLLVNTEMKKTVSTAVPELSAAQPLVQVSTYRVMGPHGSKRTLVARVLHKAPCLAGHETRPSSVTLCQCLGSSRTRAAAPPLPLSAIAALVAIVDQLKLPINNGVARTSSPHLTGGRAISVFYAVRTVPGQYHRRFCDCCGCDWLLRGGCCAVAHNCRLAISYDRPAHCESSHFQQVGLLSKSAIWQTGAAISRYLATCCCRWARSLSG
jgi:hypothetical protein